MSYAYDPELAVAEPHIPPLDISDIAAARQSVEAMRAALPPFALPEALALGTTQIKATDSGPAVSVQTISPRARRTPSPAILWFHGGGFVLGDTKSDLPGNAHLAQSLDALVASVDYALAPESPYPTAVEEGYAALAWLAEHAEEFQVDPDRIAVAGTSAGACLAAAIALRARDEHGPRIRFQALDIPVTDDRNDTASMRTFDDTPLWTRSNAELSWIAYLGDARRDDPPAYAAPARADSLQGLPPAYVSVCEFDPLRDEGIAYAQRLVQDGVSTELHLYPGTFHGSAGAVAQAAVSQRMASDLTAALARAFA